jgi:tripartite-type tricarboxylate transporter receptor subunit TctC
MTAMMNNLFTRALLTLVIGCFTSVLVAAEKYPNKPIQLIIPYTPGGNTDILGRLIAQKLGEAWGARVVVENRPGAGGTIGVNMVAKAKPDGHTLALAAFGNIIVAKSLYKDLPYDPVNDLDPVILVATPPTILTATASLKANNVNELIAYGKANPGVLNYGSSGKGTSNHLFAELFSSMSGIEMTNLIAGHTQLNFAPQPLVLASIKTGALKAIAVTGTERMSMLPDVPTVSESGLPGYHGLGWFGVVAPKGTPPGIIKKLNAEINDILNSPDVRKRLTDEGATPVGGSPEDAKRSISEGIEKWKALASKVQ